MNKDSVRPTKRFTRWLRQKLLHSVTPDGFTPIEEFSTRDIFVVGYPKSGNTWFQVLVAGAVYGVLPDIVPMSLVQELVPDVHKTPWYKRHAEAMFFKSHDLPDPRFRRVIYLLRDGRDAMVSYLHYQEAHERRQLDFAAFLQDNQRLHPCKWHKHVQAWLANPYQAEMIFVKYEDLKTDPEKELRRVCEFAGLKRSADVLELAARSATFDRMRAKEASEGPFSKSWPKDKFFCRRGQVGSYREEMPREVLEGFMQEAAPMLHECGYC